RTRRPKAAPFCSSAPTARSCAASTFSPTSTRPDMGIVVRPLAAADLPAAARINRAAFSKFFGIPDPAKFRVGADVIGPRWRLWPEAGLALELDGRLAAAGLMIRWGS